MNDYERQTQTIGAFLEALAAVYVGARIEPLARADTAHRFLIHVAANGPTPGRILQFGISDTTLAVMTAGGRYMDREHAQRYILERDVFEQIDAGDKVTI